MPLWVSSSRFCRHPFQLLVKFTRSIAPPRRETRHQSHPRTRPETLCVSGRMGSDSPASSGAGRTKLGWRNGEKWGRMAGLRVSLPLTSFGPIWLQKRPSASGRCQSAGTAQVRSCCNAGNADARRYPGLTSPGNVACPRRQKRIRNAPKRYRPIDIDRSPQDVFCYPFGQ
ncbi:MAG: hypothetical protein RLZZ436_2868, partial [Planctomycetota bacterium]